MKRIRAATAAALVSALASAAPAQDAKREPKPATFRADTALVVLDLVVRDKKGQPVRDLRPEEVQVYEDGVRRDVAAFRLVETGASAVATEAAATAAGPAAPALNPTRLLSLTTLIFEPLDGASAALARKAALQFLDRALGERSRVAVVRLGQGLSLVQPFTSNAEHLRRAVELVTNTAPDAQQSVLAQAQLAADYYRKLNAAGTHTADGAAPALTSPRDPGRAEDASGPCVICPVGAGDPGAEATERKLAEVQAIALRTTDLVQRQQQGESTLWPLLALLKAQEELAGRKTVVFFSTGLRVPPNLDSLFRTAIGQANRASVSIYAVDVRGLDTTRDLAATGAALRQAAAASYLQNTRMEGAVTRDEVETFDTAEDALRLNASGTLRDLSESTGGLLIANTNDLGKRLEQVASDLRLYYEVTYAPARSEYDGKFRKIEVKLARKGASVQARSGYFALPPGGSTLFPYEVPLLGTLTTRPQAHDFEVHAGISFAEKGEPTVAIEVPLDALPFVMDPRKKTYRLGLSILAVIKSPDGQVVERLSDDYPMTGPAGTLDALRAKRAVLRRRLALAPGEYVLETVALEKESDRASVGQWRFSVPGADAAPSAADLLSLPAGQGPTPRATGDRSAEAREAAAAKGALGELRALIARYRAGDVAGAVEARRRVATERAAADVDRLTRLRAPATRPSSREPEWTDAEVQAAALLHLDMAVEEARRGDAITARRELDTGERLAGLVLDPARRRRFHREWALGAAAFYRSRYEAGTALAILERACAAAGDDMELLLSRAVIHETLGGRAFSGSGTPRLSAAEAGETAATHLPKAEELYRRVLSSAPGQVEARLRLGRTLFLQGRNPEAIAEMDLVLAGRPSAAEALLAQLFAGAALEAAGETAQALARYEKALALDPRSRVAEMASVRLLARAARASEARAQMARLIGRTDEAQPADEPWWRYRLAGFGEDAGFEERMARLRDEVHR
ncbi:MAG TPA: VWA domain-containing protein [Vicinamibacteria bacterium]|nr:VWA domain-containing protein [Vicinamibacteria bacterium]